MKTIHIVVIVLLTASSLLSACGQKGSLYMPEKASQQEQEEAKR